MTALLSHINGQRLSQVPGTRVHNCMRQGSCNCCNAYLYMCMYESTDVGLLTVVLVIERY